MNPTAAVLDRGSCRPGARAVLWLLHTKTLSAAGIRRLSNFQDNPGVSGGTVCVYEAGHWT